MQLYNSFPSKMLSPVARIVLKVLWAFFLLVCLCLRFWINRHRFRTKWWITGDVCVTSAFVLLVPTSGMLIYENVKYLEWYSSGEKDLFLHPLLRPDIRQVVYSLVAVMELLELTQTDRYISR